MATRRFRGTEIIAPFFLIFLGALRRARATPCGPQRQARMLLALLGLSLLVTGCGGGGSSSGSGGGGEGTSTYTVGGTITGLTASGLVLANGAQTVSPASGATAFTFSTQVSSGTSYDVTVQTQPTGETCTVASGSGAVGSQNVSVAVTCTPNPTYTIGGTIAGLNTSGLVLATGTQTTAPASGATTFSFSTKEPSGTAYNITVQTQPTGETCSVASGSGIVQSQNVSVAVTCVVNTYTIQGQIAGLTASGLVLTLANTSLTVSPSSGASTFSFPTPLNYGTQYYVSVTTQPTGLTCAISGAGGQAGAASNPNILIVCGSGYTVSGTVTGLPYPVAGLVLTDGPDVTTPGWLPGSGFTPASMPFTFPPLPTGTGYAVTVQTQPSGYTCTVGNGTGTIAAANVTNVTVTCGLGAWTSLSPMPTPRGFLSAVALNGQLYAIGGFSSSANGSCLNSVEAYDPANNTWATKHAFPFHGYGFAAVTINGLIYVFGGADCDDSGNSEATVYSYDPTTNAWTLVTTMPFGAYGVMSVATDGTSAYLVGGSNAASGDFNPNIQIYDTTTATWTTGAAIENQGAGVVWKTGANGAAAALVIFGGACCGAGVTLPDNPYTEYLYFPSSNQLISEGPTTLAVAYPALDISGTETLIVQNVSTSAFPGVFCFSVCSAPYGPTGLAPPNVARTMFAGAFVNGTFYLVGGYLYSGGVYDAGTGALEAFTP
jgi:hypothetical protein